MLYGHIKLGFHPHCNFLGLVVNLVIHTHSFFSLVKDIVRFIKVFVEMGHCVILFMDFPDEIRFVLRQFAIGIIKKERILKFLTLTESFIEPVLLVKTLNILPMSRDVISGMVKYWNTI